MRRLIPLLFLLPACGSDDPTWHQDIAPLVSEHCASCHAPGLIAPFDLVTYADAAPVADWMAQEVADQTMPPWGALDTDECTPPLPWKDDARLTADEIALFQAWAAAGAPEGDAATAAPLPEPVNTDLPRVDKTLTPVDGWVAEGESDVFRCYVLDPEIAGNQWLTGLQVRPGNDAVVHHVLVFSVPSDDAEAAENLAREDGTGTFSCGAGDPLPISGGELVAAWAPGALPMRTPENTGMLLEGGGRLVMQIHYHPEGEPADVDHTSLELMWTDSNPGRPAQLALVGNEDGTPELQPGPNDPAEGPAFIIPAGAKGHTETIIFDELDLGGQDLLLWAAGTHMHWAGTDMKIVLRTQDGREQCLVQTPKWDFNWQRWYDYDGELGDLPLVKDGDTLILRCTYDNSLANPHVREALAEQGLTEPVDVVLGDETLDEMCLAVLGLTYVQ